MTTGRSVISAIEDSAVSRHALRAAEWLARDLDLRLVIAHAFDPLSVPARPSAEMLRLELTDNDLEHAGRRAAGLLLEDAARAVTGAEHSTELLEGQPAPALRHLAAELRAALLVTGTAARGGLDRMRFGSVSSALAAAAPCPVVVVPRGAALQEPGPVVAGYDGSAHSLRAARHAAALSARLGRELVLLRVTGEEGLRRSEELARDLYAAGMSGLAEDAGGSSLALTVRVAVEAGDPVQVLAGVARERAAALLVTGTRGRNTIASALLGSVSAGLVGAAGRPVVVVPASAGDTPVG